MRQVISVWLTTVTSRRRSWPARRPDRNFGSTSRARLYFTSSAVKGVPSCHFTSERSFTRQCSPSADTPPFSTVGISAARSGTKLPSGSERHSVPKRFM